MSNSNFRLGKVVETHAERGEIRKFMHGEHVWNAEEEMMVWTQVPWYFSWPISGPQSFSLYLSEAREILGVVAHPPKAKKIKAVA